MNGNARDFFFHNRPLETNLDYLKKNDTNSEVNWEGDSEFRSNSGINIAISHTKLSQFKMDTIKDEEVNQNKQKNYQSKSTLQKIHTDIENTNQKPSLSNKIVVEEEQDETEKDHQNFQQINSIQSPINDKALLGETKNKALLFQQEDIVLQKENKINYSENNNIKNQEQKTNFTNNIIPNANSKIISQQQVDLQGDYSPAGSQNTNQRKSPSNIEQSSQLHNDGNKQKSQNQKQGKENQQQQIQNKNGRDEKVKLFKFRTQIESVHEVENWKDYNRENSQDNKKNGCSCTIY